MNYHAWNPRCVEGFFGLGVGSTTDKVTKTLTETVSDTLNESINKTFNTTETTMASAVSASQDMTFDFTDCDASFAPVYLELIKGLNEGRKGCSSAESVEVMRACGELWKQPAIEDVTPCKATDITQKMIMSFDAEQSTTSDDTEKIKKALKEDLENRMSNEEDGLAAAVNTLADGAAAALESGGGVSVGESKTETTETTTLTKTSVIDRVVDIVDDKFVQDMSNSMAGNQSINITGGTTKAITQDMSLVLVAKMTAENSKFQELMEDIQKTEKIIDENKTKGITDVAEEVADTAQVGIEEGAGVANNVVDETGETSRELGGKFLDNMSTGMIVAVIGFIALLILLGFMWSSGGSEIAADVANK